MYLKKLIVEGFKSIGIKKEIDFLDAINIIMGVNGSGKSNVFECIEWVLGGKSAKQLRASNMEDVIFDGGKSAPRANFAEATLVFDNTDRDIDIDCDEIFITRKLTRGKGNDYFINHEPAKLKDIKKLFENKGIGKNNYAITGQSKITDFIMMNGEQTRHVIEEAAGISGFRVKKEEIIVSILNYDRDIERIDSVIIEMERSLKPLKKQIKNAEIYQTVKLELDQKKLYTYSKMLEKCTIKINELYDKKDSLLSERDALAKTKEDIEMFLENYSDIYNKNMDSLSSLEKDKKVLEEEISEVSKNTLMFENHKNNLLEKRDNMVSNLEKLEASTSSEGLEANDLFKGMNDLDREISSLTSEIEELTKLISEDKTKLELISKNITQATDDISALDTKFKVNESRNTTEQDSLDGLKEDKSSLEGIVAELTSELDSYKSKLADSELLLKNTKSNYAELQSIDKEIKSLENILASSKRGNNRKNKVLEIRELIKNVSGFNDVLFNLVSYDDEYSTAMESLFGGTMFNFVVDNASSANKCIDILKKNKIPPEKFIVLDKITSRNKTVQALENAINVHSILKVDSKYTTLVEEYFTNNFIADNDKDAELAWNSCSQKYRVVTLDGTLYAANIIKGGFIQKNIKQAQKELNSLLEKKTTLLTVAGEVLNNTYELKSKIELISSSNNGLRSSMQSLQDRLTKESTKLQKVKDTIARYEDNARNFDSVQEGILNDKKSKEDTLKSLMKEKMSVEDSLSSKESSKDEKSTKITSSKTLLEEYEKNYFIFKNNSKEKIESLKSDISIINGQIEDVSKSHADSLDTENNLSSKISSVEESILSYKAEIEKMISEKDEKNASLTKLIEDIASIDNSTIKIDFDVEKITENEDSYREHLRDIPDEVELVEFEEDINVLLKDVSSLEKKIKSLGFINTDALSEYEELNERYSLMASNKADLEESKSKLLAVVQELQDKMLDKYVTCFNEIQKDFTEIFKRLFAGGDAELIMENPDAPLTSEVIIKATPPGKKNKPLSLLSGGEKSLAAVSFIFALLKYSPSPVVIFDEIDAALDEINVSLIADYISENKNVQYIIVSHRKPMMKSADVIYTAMMTNGITNLISTKLNDKTA